MADLADTITEKYEYLRIKYQPILMMETVLCLGSFDNFRLYLLSRKNANKQRETNYYPKLHSAV